MKINFIHAVTTICILTFFSSAWILADEAVPQTLKSVEGKTLKLVWNDEFNGTGDVNPADWKYEHGFVRNKEKQFYTDKRAENVYQKDGKLVIVGIKEAYEENGVKADYTSGSIHTAGLHEWKYGRIEVRAKLPKGKGVWPAIWTTGSGAPYPLSGEIDIMEYVGFNPTQVHATIHGKGKGERPYCSQGGHIRIPNIEDRMAVYAVEWTHDRIWFFVDDQMYFSVDLNKFNAVGRPFDYPQRLKLNLALGGSWGGPIDDSIFPQTFEIDYVRVYQFEDAEQGTQANKDEITPFDGTLKNWTAVTKFDFEDAPEPKVVDGAIRITKGDPGAGIKYNGEIPKINYELSYQARRVDGNDFFGLAVIPYKDKSFGFVLGGWGGTLCGFSCIDGFSADENSSTFTYDFKNNVWYDVKLRITEKELVVFINGEKMVAVDMEDREISNRMEMEPVEPFGFATWYTTADIRNIKIKKVEK